ncbi:hypothetical protein BB8028_0001g12190 [Beauveria bassiana]|uniref:Nucleoside phosphorylase domain-containing protein n=1 Tax=Beauveria bassiana TaxID=176275 RepID=A0A2S7XZ80_BEABA|nr:hypothetical protein BB8028_0001g12190 [Beauveria bassiana]
MSTFAPRLPRPTTCHSFEIALICALPHEVDPCDALFDCHWDPPLGKANGDPNVYTTGCIGRHNIVLVHMPSMGKISAAVATSYCRTSFPNIKLAIVVGICGVVPFCVTKGEDITEIILGDVIISDAVIHHDHGQQLPDGFVRKETLLGLAVETHSHISGLLAKLKMRRHKKQLSLQTAINLGILQNNPELSADYPDATFDKLFQATYHHTSNRQTCEQGCSGTLIRRRRLVGAEGHPRPAIHFGLVASGDMVVKSGEYRDAIAEKEGAIAFEMEGAGARANFPCIIVKSACDYADSHKSEKWQNYAAATSAACMKAILDHWLPPLSRDISMEDVLALLDRARVQNERSRSKIESSDAKMKTNDAMMSDTTQAFIQFLSGLLLAWYLGPGTIIQRLDSQLNANRLTLQHVIDSDRNIASELRSEEEIAREIVDSLQMAAYSIRDRENASLLVQDKARGEKVTSSRAPDSEKSQSSDDITSETLGGETVEVGQFPISAELEAARQERDELVGQLQRLEDQCKKLQETVNRMAAKSLEIEAKGEDLEERMREAERLRREYDNQSAFARLWYWILWLSSCGYNS